MVVEPKKTTIAYRCPECGATVYSVVGVFALSGDIIKLKCNCGGSELVLENTSDGKVRMTVPCIFCPNPHQFLISRKTVLSRDLFAFPCAYAGFDICFIGDEGKVKEAVAQSDKELYEALSEEERNQLRDKNKELTDYTDEHMADMIIYTLGQLAEDGKILCDCTDGGDFLCEKTDRSVIISCKKCGAKREFFAADTLDTRSLLEADSLYLKKPDQQK